MAGRGFADINASLRYARVCHAADDSPEYQLKRLN